MLEKLFGNLGEAIYAGNWFLVGGIAVILIGVLVYFLHSLDLKSPNDF